MPVRVWAVIVTLFLCVSACRSTEPVAPAFPKPTPQGPSQTKAEAKRDGVPPKIAAMTISDRLEVSGAKSPSITTDEGVWTIARPTVVPSYAEVLLLDARREKIIKATPMPGAPAFELELTDDSVICRGEDGTTLCRIDRTTLEFDRS
jgi:hypothetical protein